MIDLHSHILPNLDDGPQSIEESVAMARLAAEDGVRSIVVTPHVAHPMFHVNMDDRDNAIDMLQTRLTDENIPIKLIPGAECHLNSNMPDEFEANPWLHLGQGKWILLEWPDHTTLFLVKPLLFQAQVKGISFLLAHAERHPDAKRAEGMVDLVRCGLKLQINAQSLTKRFGGSSGRNAKRLLRDGLCYVIASDAHNVKKRPPYLSAAVEEAKKIIGPKADQLVSAHPRTILNIG